MNRDEAIRTHTIGELEAFRAAIDRLLAMPGPYLDPAVTPDPTRNETFYARYDKLRAGMKRDFGEALERSLSARRFHEHQGGDAPVGGALRRPDVEALRDDVEACLAALRSPRR